MGNFISVTNKVNIVVGTVGMLGGLLAYAKLPSGALVPMQFGLDGSVGWSIQSKHAFLFYPLMSLFFGVVPFLLTSRKSTSINFPFSFDPSMAECQRNLALGYLSLLHLTLGVFFAGASSVWVPQVIQDSSPSMSAKPVVGLVSIIACLSVGYFVRAWQQRHPI